MTATRFFCAVLATLTPVLAEHLEPDTSFVVVYALRVVQGLLQAPCWPSLNPLVNR